MSLGSQPFQEPTGSDPLPPGVLKIAAEMTDRAFLISQRGYYREQLLDNDSLKERLKFEIRDDLRYMQGAMPAFLDFKDQLTPDVLAILARVEEDLLIVNRYLDEDWPEYPYEKLLDDSTALYEELEG